MHIPHAGRFSGVKGIGGSTVLFHYKQVCANGKRFLVFLGGGGHFYTLEANCPLNLKSLTASFQT